MHGDGPGMPVGEADEELCFSPTNNGPAAGSGANGSPASGGTLHGGWWRPEATAIAIAAKLALRRALKPIASIAIPDCVATTSELMP